MRMITFRVEAAQFNVRVAGIAVAHGCVLLHQMSGDAFWTLPGGRPEVMETGAAALRREMREETGLEVRVGRLLCIAENFFTYRATAFHEIVMCFEMSTPSSAEVVDQRFDGTKRQRPPHLLVVSVGRPGRGPAASGLSPRCSSDASEFSPPSRSG